MTMTSSSRKCSFCDKQSCPYRETFCFDEDYLADRNDFLINPAFHIKLWKLFNNPPMKADLGPDVAKYEVNLARCQRIIDKRQEIETEKEANTLKYFRERGYSGPDFSEFIDRSEDINEKTKKM